MVTANSPPLRPWERRLLLSAGTGVSNMSGARSSAAGPHSYGAVRVRSPPLPSSAAVAHARAERDAPEQPQHQKAGATRQRDLTANPHRTGRVRKQNEQQARHGCRRRVPWPALLQLLQPVARRTEPEDVELPSRICTAAGDGGFGSDTGLPSTTSGQRAARHPTGGPCYYSARSVRTSTRS